MTTLVYPTLPSGKKPDAKQFHEEIENPAHSTELEGGYVATRPKHTRQPRVDFHLTYVEISDADKNAITNFWNTVRGSSVAFNWSHPKTGQVFTVRFKPGEALKWSYTGAGVYQVWNCSFVLSQA